MRARAAGKPHDGARWGFALSLGKDPISGRRLQERRSTFDTKRAAQAAEAKVRAAHADNKRSTAKPIRLGDWLNEWHSGRVLRREIKPTTIGMYTRYVNELQSTSLAAMKLTDIRHVHVQSLIDDLARTRGAATVRRIGAVLQGAFTAAEKQEKILGNPGGGLIWPTAEAKERPWWTVEQTREFFAAIDGTRLAPLWKIALTTGMRRGELLGLRRSYVDLVDGSLLVRESRVSAIGSGVVQQKSTKTTAGRRRIELGAAHVAILREQFEMQDREREVAGALWQGEDDLHVFTYEDGRPFRPEYVSGRWKVVTAKLNLPKMPLHSTRHTHLTHLIESGARPDVVAARGGHDVRTLMGTYTHQFDGAQRAASDAVSSRLFDAV